MRTLILGDLHLNERPKGMLEAQVACVKSIIKKASSSGIGRIIFLGDVFMHRKPCPSVLLAFKDILSEIQYNQYCVILRGNHDSETKADDGVTALSLFDNGSTVGVITHTKTDPFDKTVYIPHYEDESRIKDALVEVPKGYTVFGHFGYRGCLNSAGDIDSTIRLIDFQTLTFLGHIHKFVVQDSPASLKEVIILGTPYSTNFGEAGKDNFYAIMDGKGGTTFHKVESGPRHLIFNAKDIEANLEEINDPAYFTMLRVQVDADHFPIPYDKLNVASIDVTYNPIFNEESLSTFSPERDLYSINEVIIEDYVDGANSIIDKEILMEGYRGLKDED
jgi:DNA repair exonuclease SbcCD nuclease subunit